MTEMYKGMKKKRFLVTLVVREIAPPDEFFISICSVKSNVICATGEEAITAAFGLLKTPENFYVHTVEILETLK
jgi:hypothetical protein